MSFTGFAGICLGLLAAASPSEAQTTDEPARHPAAMQPSSETAPAPPRTESPPMEPGEISHEEMVKEQERRDREEEAERDRDDQ